MNNHRRLVYLLQFQNTAQSVLNQEDTFPPGPIACQGQLWTAALPVPSVMRLSVPCRPTICKACQHQHSDPWNPDVLGFSNSEG